MWAAERPGSRPVDRERLSAHIDNTYARIDADRLISLIRRRLAGPGAPIVGHSQGDVGAVNAVTVQPHKDVFKTAVVLPPTNKALAAELEWYYDATQIRVPTFLISGAGGGDDWVVTGEQLGQIYADIRGEKLMVPRKDTPHNEVLYAPNGYVVAWLMW